MKIELMTRLILMVLLATGLLAACASEDQPRQQAEQQADTAAETPLNTLTQEEVDEGWVLLFDGQSTDGWRNYLSDSFPEAGWTIEDGALRVIGVGMGEGGGEGGDIIYDEQFHNFRLSLEWKVSEGGNSGIFYLAQELENTPIWHTAPEMQILDNENHPDAARGVDGNRKAGSLYDLLPATPQNSNPAGEWNHAEVLVYRGTVVHFQNGEKVVEFDLGTPDWDEMVANSKFSELEHFGEYVPGYIGLQDHSDDVWFRNIKILNLDE